MGLSYLLLSCSKLEFLAQRGECSEVMKVGQPQLWAVKSGIEAGDFRCFFRGSFRFCGESTRVAACFVRFHQIRYIHWFEAGGSGG